MTTPDCLKLLALDEEDLAILSAHLQDAVMTIRDLQYLPREGRFALAANRFAWEKVDGARRDYERRRTALVFDKVKAVSTRSLPRDRDDVVLELLAIGFDAGDAPAGFVTLHFAGGASVRLEVECIEARLCDLGAAWATARKPSHDLSAETPA